MNFVLKFVHKIREKFPHEFMREFADEFDISKQRIWGKSIINTIDLPV